MLSGTQVDISLHHACLSPVQAVLVVKLLDFKSSLQVYVDTYAPRLSKALVTANTQYKAGTMSTNLLSFLTKSFKVQKDADDETFKFRINAQADYIFKQVRRSYQQGRVYMLEARPCVPSVRMKISVSKNEEQSCPLKYGACSRCSLPASSVVVCLSSTGESIRLHLLHPEYVHATTY